MADFCYYFFATTLLLLNFYTFSHNVLIVLLDIFSFIPTIHFDFLPSPLPPNTVVQKFWLKEYSMLLFFAIKTLFEG